jgi:hypothetical protein
MKRASLRTSTGAARLSFADEASAWRGTWRYFDGGRRAITSGTLAAVAACSGPRLRGGFSPGSRLARLACLALRADCAASAATILAAFAARSVASSSLPLEAAVSPSVLHEGPRVRELAQSWA